MRSIVDQPLPALRADHLCSLGHEATHVRELAMDLALDIEIVRPAASAEAVIVSKDENYSRLTSRTDSNIRLIWFRLGNCANRVLMDRFITDWSRIDMPLQSGVRIVELS